MHISGLQKLTLLDYPGKTAATVFELMLDLNRAQGTSLALVTHDRRLARKLDRVVELHEGKLREVAREDV